MTGKVVTFPQSKLERAIEKRFSSLEKEERRFIIEACKRYPEPEPNDFEKASETHMSMLSEIITLKHLLYHTDPEMLASHEALMESDSK